MKNHNHTRLVGVQSNPPPYRVSQDEVREFAQRFFTGKLKGLDRMLASFSNAEIDSRHLCVPITWFSEPKTVQQKNDTYIKQSVELSAEAITDLLQRFALLPKDIDFLIFVSSTGLATPSIDARLIGKLGFRSDTKRIPVWGLGCAGGAMGIAHANDILLGNPTAKALLINVELCSLTFQFSDFSKSNLIATALFADGVTATLFGGADSELPGHSIIAGGTTLWPDSLDVMGWNLQNDGMQVVFSQSIPAIVKEKMNSCLVEFLAESKLELSDIAHFLIHPGGRKVLEAYVEALDKPTSAFSLSADVIREHGNCSSATVMMVLERFLADQKFSSGELALLTALGPGFSAGNILLQL
jgi:alkylresorcinol/alkylpyrone synthase